MNTVSSPILDVPLDEKGAAATPSCKGSTPVKLSAGLWEWEPRARPAGEHAGRFAEHGVSDAWFRAWRRRAWSKRPLFRRV